MQRLGASVLRSTFRTRPRRALRPYFSQWQAFHRSRPVRGDGDASRDSPAAPAPVLNPDSPPVPQTTAMPQSDDTKTASIAAVDPHSGTSHTQSSTTSPVSSNLSPKDLDYLKSLLEIDDADLDEPLSSEERASAEKFAANPPEEVRPLVEMLKAAVAEAEAEADAQVNELLTGTPSAQGYLLDPPPPTRNEEGVLAMSQPVGERFPDEPYEGDDVTTLAHSELDQHRELRRYMRLIAWEMPHLSKFAKPFELPSSDRPLRFRYTTYMGESHPAENKVVLEFCTADLPLTPKQRLKLIKIVGVRYNPQTDAVKMSCESFSSQAQNKRYLGDVVDNLIRVAKGKGDTPEAKDTYEDIPVDFRHVKWKKTLEFPDQWKLDPEKRQILAAKRAQLKVEEQKRLEEGGIVNGMKIIEDSYAIASPLLQQRARAGRSLQRREGRI